MISDNLNRCMSAGRRRRVTIGVVVSLIVLVVIVIVAMCVPFNMYFPMRSTSMNRAPWLRRRRRHRALRAKRSPSSAPACSRASASAPASASTRELASILSSSELEEKVPFPRIVHQTWKTRELLDFQERNRNEWMAAFPTFEWRLHTDADLDPMVERHFPWFVETWRSLDPFIKKVDAIRYMWMYVYGGVYLDLDMALVDARRFRALVARPYPRNTLCVPSNSSHTRFLFTAPCMLMSHPGHEFWIRMLEYVQKNSRRKVYASTGPTAMSIVMRRYLRDRSRTGHVQLVSSSLFGLMPKNPFVKKICEHQGSNLWN